MPQIQPGVCSSFPWENSLMDTKTSRLVVVAAVLVTVACATSAKSTGTVVGTAGTPVAVAQVDVYGPGQQMPDEASYAVVVEYTRKVGIDAESVNEAVAEFREQAAKLGCDALLILSHDIGRSAKQGQSGQNADEGFAAAGANMNTVESRELEAVGVRWKKSKDQ